ncbi:Protein FAM84A [Acipenser ruthenus]|uniref:Protein FAM84A n=1 Tax=Acipenser ruthenus TaxID=7906 RepID=A0A444UPD1_ACIRT|nr:Protein FAM84A [Acipenser ruthenus]
MGNQLDRITHLNYSELPTGDPAGIEKDELRVGVAYFFSDEEEDLDDRSQPENYKDQSPSKDGHIVLNEIEYSAFCCQECIFSKLRENEDLTIYSIKTLLTVCKPGDLVELVYVANDQQPHWAIYEGKGHIIHLYKGEIRKDSLYEISNGRLGRIVNNWYRYRPLPADLVMQNACGHLGLRTDEICWTNSESFAAWCRFGKREFKAGGEIQTAEQRYFLKIHVSENNVHSLMFHSLEDLIREKRKMDASGKLRVIKEFPIVNVKEEKHNTVTP